MAWLMGSGDHVKQVEGIWFKTPEGGAAFNKHLLSVQTEMLGIELPDVDLFYTKGLFVPPPPTVPELYIPKRMKKIRHVMDSEVGVLFSDTAKDIIEEIEPGVHGFYPVNVEGLEERGFKDQYYIVNIRSRLNSVMRDVPQSQEFFDSLLIPDTHRHAYFEDYHFRMYYERLALQNDQPNIFVKKSIIAGRALWAEYGVPKSRPAFFACDEFVKRLGRSAFGAVSPDVKVGEMEG